MSQNLTLNLGLRYDIEVGLTERFDRILRGFDLATPSPIDAPVRAAYTTVFNANREFPGGPEPVSRAWRLHLC